MKIGLFGGSFNPVHKGHLNIIKYSFKYLELDKLIAIPCYQSIDKKAELYAPAEDRVKMLEEVLPERCFITLFEVNHKKALESYQTVRYLKSLFPEDSLFFIIGEDNLSGIERWENILEISQNTKIVVFRRFPKKIKPKINLDLLWMENEIWEYSSTEFRKSKSKILDEKTEKYIQKNKLYNLY